MTNKVLTGVFLISTVLGFTAIAHAQTPGTSFESCPANPARNPVGAASIAERNRELKVLGIAKMRPAVGAYNIGKPCNANYDEALANPYPNLPDALRTSAGVKVTTAKQWWDVRRPEIAKLFQSQIYGFVPKDAPKVTWTVTRTLHQTIGGIAVVTKELTGHVDNSRYRAITVNIRANLVTPADRQGHAVPVMVMNSNRVAPGNMTPPSAGLPHNADYYDLMGVDNLRKILSRGWGYAAIDSTSVQPDSWAKGTGIGKGIIGLANRGKPRTMDQWGVVRAWAWGDSRLMDYLLTDKAVDPHKIGIFGHSRYGKAALVAMAYDQRFAIGYISASGAGGANLYRRNYGEPLANLTGPNEFYWFAGNLMKYGAVGKTPNDLPVDSHELIAMCAPRPIFISGGILMTEPGKIPGDAWQDAHGMFMAEVAAGPVYKLLGAKGLGTATMPPPLTLIDSGDLAFRQHRDGHTPGPNWPYFLQFAAKKFANH